MKSGLFSALLTLVLMLLINFSTYAQTPNQMMSKFATGPISKTSFSMTLAPDVCDQTQAIVPDRSRVVATSFSMKLDANGMGTFQGTVVMVAPDGTVLMTGSVFGTVGSTSNRGENTPGLPCQIPTHIEGMVIFPNSNNPSLSMMASFSVNQIVEAGSPMTIYQGHMDGIMTVGSQNRRTSFTSPR